MCVLRLQVTGHVLGHLSTTDMMTSLGFQFHGDAMRVLNQARDCLQGSDLHPSSGFFQDMCPLSVAQWLEDCKLPAFAEKFLEENMFGRGLLGVTSGELLSMNLLSYFKAVEVFFSERDKVLLEGGSAEEGSAMVSESYGECVLASEERGADADANQDESQFNWDAGQHHVKAKSVCVPGEAFAKSAGLVCDAAQSQVVGGIAAPSTPQPLQNMACVDSICSNEAAYNPVHGSMGAWHGISKATVANFIIFNDSGAEQRFCHSNSYAAYL